MTDILTVFDSDVNGSIPAHDQRALRTASIGDIREVHIVMRPRHSNGASPPLKVQIAYEELKRRILTLELLPGTPIDEKALTSDLEIGRTPLREAVLRLSHERLIEHSPRRGAWVSELSFTQLQQMLDARWFIEPLVTRRATERATDGEIDELTALLSNAPVGSEDVMARELVQIDLEFHSRIADMNANSYFADFSRQINVAMLRYWHMSSRHVDTLPTWLDNHRLILSSIAARDPDRAEQQARDHIAGFRQRLQELLA
jgi:DNA-binding GntR family transcriptional regulator